MIEQISGEDPVPRRPRTVFKLNEDKLFAVGMDRPMVEAFRHLLTAAGTTPGATLPETVASLEALAAVIDAMPSSVPPLPFPDDLTPMQQIAAVVEQIYTETRQNAEAIAALQSTIDDLKKGIYP